MSTKTINRVWVLGAPDPEMEMIEKLLRDCGETVVHATTPDGQRVRTETAYRCPAPEVPEGATVYAVECIDVLPDGWVRIDHHRPGDPGYGRPPSEFLAASSLGQVIAELARLGRLPQSWETSGAPEGFDRERGIIQHWHDGHRRYLCSTVVSIAYGETGDASYGGDGGSLATIPHDLVLTAAADHCLGAAYRGECPGVDPVAGGYTP
jgi:hypothetical protein